MSKSARWKPGKDPRKIIAPAAYLGVSKAAEHVLGEARKIVPHEEGNLEKSGSTTTEQGAGTTRSAVSFDTPYALKQHEDLTLKHDKGREAKYLEKPLNAEKDEALKIIADELRNALK